MPNRTIIRATVTRRNGGRSPAVTGEANGVSSPQPQPSAPVAQPLNLESFPDPLAALDWNHALDGAVTRLWDRLSVPLSFVAWSAFCFLLGWLL